MNKKQLSERDICTKFITPSLRQAGWDEITQLREGVSFTKGRIIVRGKLVTRGKAKRADYILYYKPNIPLAVLEAKDNNCSVGDGIQQALGYAETLQILFVFSSNGGGKKPHYFQASAVNAATEAIAKGQNRLLLAMATGTGKTYTAFQIIWRLWKAGRKKRILYLADRNVLIDQTMVNDFRPFGAAMAKLSANAKTIEREDGSTIDLTLALDRRRRI